MALRFQATDHHDDNGSTVIDDRLDELDEFVHDLNQHLGPDHQLVVGAGVVHINRGADDHYCASIDDYHPANGWVCSVWARIRSVL